MAKVIEMGAPKVAKDELKEKDAAMRAAVEKANKEAGYDIAMAFAALNAVTIHGQSKEKMPLFASQCDLTAAVDVMMRGFGGNLGDNWLTALLNFAVAYGYYYAETGESLVRSEEVRDSLLSFVDNNPKLLVDERVKRKDAVVRGWDALGKAVEVAEKRMKTVRAMGKR